MNRHTNVLYLYLLQLLLLNQYTHTLNTTDECNTVLIDFLLRIINALSTSIKISLKQHYNSQTHDSVKHQHWKGYCCHNNGARSYIQCIYYVLLQWTNDWDQLVLHLYCIAHDRRAMLIFVIKFLYPFVDALLFQRMNYSATPLFRSHTHIHNVNVERD